MLKSCTECLLISLSPLNKQSLILNGELVITLRDENNRCPTLHLERLVPLGISVHLILFVSHSLILELCIKHSPLKTPGATVLYIC